jgi:hypothetical protein
VFGNLIDDLKAKVDGMLKLAVAGAIVAAAAVTAFACFTVALFLWMQQTYGSLEAWLAVGALFAAIAALGGIVVLFLRGRTRKVVTPRPQEPNAVARLLQEPAVLLTGLQIVRLLGRRGLLPMIVLGVVAGGIMMNHRNGHAGREHVAEAERGAQTDLHG